MRVLLLGSPNHDKIAQALRKEHYLYDFMANPEKEAAGIPEGVYDAAILLADCTDNQFAVQLSRTLCAIGSAVQIHAERGVGYYLEA